MLYVWHYDSPLGGMTLTGDESALFSLGFDNPSSASLPPAQELVARRLPVFEETVRWLDRYFSGVAPDFIPPLHPQGTPFRRSVWEILLGIPFGETMTYGQIAARLTLPDRGIPCHRVIGADGSLTGYAAGLDRKSWLLRHEQILNG